MKNDIKFAIALNEEDVAALQHEAKVAQLYMQKYQVPVSPLSRAVVKIVGAMPATESGDG